MMTQSNVNEVSAHMAAEDYDNRLGQHTQTLMRFFRSKGFNEDDSQDLTQDTLELGLRRKPDYKEQGAFEGWLITLARNVLSSFKRYNEAGKRSADVCPFTEEDLGSQLATFHRHHALADPSLARTLFENIDRLPAELNHVVVLQGLGHSFDDIARLLRTKRHIVVKRYEQALKTLVAEWRS